MFDREHYKAATQPGQAALGTGPWPPATTCSPCAARP